MGDISDKFIQEKNNLFITDAESLLAIFMGHVSRSAHRTPNFTNPEYVCLFTSSIFSR